MLLSGGIHSFPFKLGLPLGLPSTFLGKHGWVQYFCKAALREESGLTHKNQQVFIIMNPIDLNLEPPILAVRRIRCLKFIDIVLLNSRRCLNIFRFWCKLHSQGYCVLGIQIGVVAFFHRQKLMVLSNSLLKRRSRFRNARNNFMSYHGTFYQRSIFEKIVTILTPKKCSFVNLIFR